MSQPSSSRMGEEFRRLDDELAVAVTLPPVDTVIDAQPTSDGLTLLHRQGSTVTIRHVTSDTSAK